MEVSAMTAGRSILVASLTILGACGVSALAEEPPPIQVIIDLHMDPLNGIPLANRPTVYAAWRDAAEWMMDECDARGAKVTFLSVGEYMEYTLADPGSWPLIQRLAAGGTLGTHSHSEKKYGPHDWRDLPANAPMQLVIASWQDHIMAVDAVVAAALGFSDPNEYRTINNSRGAHLPRANAFSGPNFRC
jgi:hypothetical protein